MFTPVFLLKYTCEFLKAVIHQRKINSFLTEHRITEQDSLKFSVIAMVNPQP